MSVYIALVVLICSFLQNTSAQGGSLAFVTLEFRVENQPKLCRGLLLSSEWFITKKGCTKGLPGYEIVKVIGKEVWPLAGLFSEDHFGGPKYKENYELLHSLVPISLEVPHAVLTKDAKQPFAEIHKAIHDRCNGPDKDAFVTAVLKGVGFSPKDKKRSICNQQWKKAPLALSKRSVFGVPEVKGGFAKVIFGPASPSGEPGDPGFNGIGDTDTIIGYAYNEPLNLQSARQANPRTRSAQPGTAIRVLGAPGFLGVWGPPGIYGARSQENYAFTGSRYAEESFDTSPQQSFEQPANLNLPEQFNPSPNPSPNPEPGFPVIAAAPPADLPVAAPAPAPLMAAPAPGSMSGYLGYPGQGAYAQVPTYPPYMPPPYTQGQAVPNMGPAVPNMGPAIPNMGPLVPNMGPAGAATRKAVLMRTDDNNANQPKAIIEAVP